MFLIPAMHQTPISIFVFAAEYEPIASQCSNLTDASIFLSGTYEVGGGTQHCDLTGIVTFLNAGSCRQYSDSFNI